MATAIQDDLPYTAGDTWDLSPYYDRMARIYAERTDLVDMAVFQDPFLEMLSPGARILDAGCGPGRDAAAFLRRGFEVVAIDASAEMIAIARGHVGDRAQQMRFEDVPWAEEFDALWCCASLLHVPHKRFPDVARRLLGTLRPGGIWFCCFKQGIGTSIRDGRPFADHTPETLRAALDALPVHVERIWTDGDLRPERPEISWVMALSRRP